MSLRGAGLRERQTHDDVLAHRVTDWYRSKASGNGDARYGNDNRIVLSAMDADEAIDTELDFEKLVSERRLAEWQEAAQAVDLPLTEWIVQTLDRATRVIRRAGAR